MGASERDTRGKQPTRYAPPPRKEAPRREDDWDSELDGLILRWQEGPWVSRYPMPGPADEALDGHVVPPSRGTRRGRHRPCGSR